MGCYAHLFFIIILFLFIFFKDLIMGNKSLSSENVFKHLFSAPKKEHLLPNVLAAIKLLELQPNLKVDNFQVVAAHKITNLLNFLSGIYYGEIFFDDFDKKIDIKNKEYDINQNGLSDFSSLLVVELIEHGLDPWENDKNGINAFECALLAGNIKLANTMLALPQAPNIKEIERQYKNYGLSGQTKSSLMAAYIHEVSSRPVYAEYLFHLGFNKNLIDVNGIPAFLYAKNNAIYDYLFNKFDKSKIDSNYGGDLLRFIHKHGNGFIYNSVKNSFTKYLEGIKNNSQDSLNDIYYENFILKTIKDKSSLLFDLESRLKRINNKKDVPAEDIIQFKFNKKGHKNYHGNWTILSAICWDSFKAEGVWSAINKTNLDYIWRIIHDVNQDNLKNWLSSEFRDGVSNQTLLLLAFGRDFNKNGALNYKRKVERFIQDVTGQTIKDINLKLLDEGATFYKSLQQGTKLCLQVSNFYENIQFDIVKSYLDKDDLFDDFFLKLLSNENLSLNRINFDSQIKIVNYLLSKENAGFSEIDILLGYKSLNFISEIYSMYEDPFYKDSQADPHIVKLFEDADKLIKNELNKIDCIELIKKIEKYPYDSRINEQNRKFIIPEVDWNALIYGLKVKSGLNDGIKKELLSLDEKNKDKRNVKLKI